MKINWVWTLCNTAISWTKDEHITIDEINKICHVCLLFSAECSNMPAIWQRYIPCWARCISLSKRGNIIAANIRFRITKEIVAVWCGALLKNITGHENGMDKRGSQNKNIIMNLICFSIILTYIHTQLITWGSSILLSSTAWFLILFLIETNKVYDIPKGRFTFRAVQSIAGCRYKVAGDWSDSWTDTILVHLIIEETDWSAELVTVGSTL